MNREPLVLLSPSLPLSHSAPQIHVSILHREDNGEVTPVNLTKDGRVTPSNKVWTRINGFTTMSSGYTITLAVVAVATLIHNHTT